MGRKRLSPRNHPGRTTPTERGTPAPRQRSLHRGVGDGGLARWVETLPP